MVIYTKSLREFNLLVASCKFRIHNFSQCRLGFFQRRRARKGKSDILFNESNPKVPCVDSLRENALCIMQQCEFFKDCSEIVFV